MHVFLIVVLVALIAAALLWWHQEKILFQPPGRVSVGQLSARKITYTASDGQELFGYLVGDVACSRILLVFHGNADLAMWQLEWAAEVVGRFGVAVFLAEYRGYAGISGKSSYLTSALDAEAAYEVVASDFQFPQAGILLFGHSLGSAVAAELALRHNAPALILQSPFSSASEMARLILTRPVSLLWKIVSRIHFDTLKIVQETDSRVSVIHGTRDMVIPSRMGAEVFSAARNPGTFALVEKAGHNNVVEVAGEKYWDWMREALGTPDTTG